VTALQRAVALDPQFAVAWSWLGAAQIGLGEFAATQDQRVTLHKQGLECLDKAIANDPGLVEPYAVRAWYRCNIALDFRGGEADLQHAGLFDIYQATALAGYGGAQPCFRPSRLQEALELDRRFIHADPLSVAAWQFYGAHLALAGDKPQSRAAYQRALDLSPDAGWSRLLMGLTELYDSHAETALANFRRAGPALGETGIAMAEFTLGHERESQAALATLKTRYPAGMAMQVAWVYAWRGEKDLAFQWLERAAEQHDAGIVRLRYEMPLASLRSDPRFSALVEKLGLPE
jgi:tetratricopeptide (TPR) repeat protein